MVIGLIKSPKFMGVYKRIIRELGYGYKILDLDQPGWAGKIGELDPAVDVYFWHSIDRGAYYRRDILDPLYFIEKFSRRKIYPDYNQYFFYNDKLKQKWILQLKKVLTPRTFYTCKKQAALDFARKARYPFVLKDPHSASSLGVYLVEDIAQAKEYIEKIFSPGGLNSLFWQFLAEQFISGLNRSLRVITINHKTYCAYWRRTEDDWRHRLADKSCLVSQQDVPPAAKKICETLSKKLGFHWMAWDLLVAGDKIYMLKFACNFGTQGAEKLGYNPKREIIKYVVSHK